MQTTLKIKIPWVTHVGKELLREVSRQDIKILVEASKVGSLHSLSPLFPKEPKGKIRT